MSLPGQFPYTRGATALGYRERPWIMVVGAGSGIPEAGNARLKQLAAEGASGLAIAVDRPTRRGCDADAAEEVGRAGLSLGTMEDARVLLDGVPALPVYLDAGSVAPVLLAFLVAARGPDLAGASRGDVLESAAAGEPQPWPLELSLRLASDAIVWAGREHPRWQPVTPSAAALRDAGATASQEIAFALASGEAWQAIGLSEPLFHFSIHRDLLEEIAKYRAARRLWAMRQGLPLRFHARVAGPTLAAEQLDVNLVRISLGLMAAALGGADSIEAATRDQPLGASAADSARLALRMQQMLAGETGIGLTADPAGGSLVIEQRAEALEREAVEILGRIDALGGWRPAVERGVPLSWIAALPKVDPMIVGVTRFRSGEPPPPPRFDSTAAAVQRERLREIRASRSASQWEQALARLRAAGAENLMPYLIEAARAHATLGEIAASLAHAGFSGA